MIWVLKPRNEALRLGCLDSSPNPPPAKAQKAQGQLEHARSGAGHRGTSDRHRRLRTAVCLQAQGVPYLSTQTTVCTLGLPQRPQRQSPQLASSQTTASDPSYGLCEPAQREKHYSCGPTPSRDTRSPQGDVVVVLTLMHPCPARPHARVSARFAGRVLVSKDAKRPSCWSRRQTSEDVSQDS